MKLFVEILLGVMMAIIATVGCSSPPNVIIQETQGQDDYDASRDVCSTASGYNRPECQPVEYEYRVIGNTCTTCADSNDVVDILLDDPDRRYSVLWTNVMKDGNKYEWTIEFVPKDCAQTSRAMRFIPIERFPVGTSRGTGAPDTGDTVEDDEGQQIIEAPIKPRRNSNFSTEMVFDVDTTPINNMPKNDPDLEGDIEIKVQDVTYCQRQNRVNRDVSNNQVDCSNAQLDDSYFRTDIIRVPYKLSRTNWNTAELVCDAVSVANSLGKWGKLIGQLSQTLILKSSECQDKRVSTCQ
ncbi:MAG: hypothetical protein OXC40_02165 [Proteobacteria bacterium]|nr:hypothetical protein [Pseudomonadota bacterium]